ncbi:DUF862-domain-containing protein [Glonium stellatum]|uniref:DUF862-domain-containing protein n=1 Tax=Glonium stellatum TaxID=574774 RepID=A0A8E2FBT7_9PEZI|nr:DUF862-domain-containing protein [Glonium stellatum]
MEVQLYVYDLSKGLARQLSAQFLGTHIDAVYHTSLVFGGIEYFFGQGVQTCYSGMTHHGAPMEIIPMGETSLPMEIIREYLDSLKQIYTPESYDLFLHNCNNFSNDFAMFLVGKGIPDHITSLPQTVLNTPFGQMLRPQIDNAMRSITQAPVPEQQTSLAHTSASNTTINGFSHVPLPVFESRVHNITSLHEMEKLLNLAANSCAIIFFTSSTCAPCKLLYPAYDNLATEFGTKAMFIKVDINDAYTIAAKYNVRVTPTVLTYLKGLKQDEWSGADERQLRSNVNILLGAAFPSHPHLSRNVSNLLHTNLHPVIYSKLPPLDKLIARMGDAGHDPVITTIVSFIRTLRGSGAIEAPLPPLPAFARFIQSSTTSLPAELLFTALDLLRAALTDSRVAGFFAEEHTTNIQTIRHILAHVNCLGADAPYNLRLTTLHLACNLFNSQLFIPHLLSPPISAALISLITSALLDENHTALRASATTLALNLAGANHKFRMRTLERHANSPLNFSEIPEVEQVELLASLLETLSTEKESAEVVRMSVIAVGWIAYCAPSGGEVSDLCKAMDAGGTVAGLEKTKAIQGRDDIQLVREVGNELLEKGW